jgi:hypothetical protein
MKGIIMKDCKANLQLNTTNLLILSERMQIGKKEALITEYKRISHEMPPAEI